MEPIPGHDAWLTDAPEPVEPDTSGLLPCPFCGATSEKLDIYVSPLRCEEEFWVTCDDCGARGPRSSWISSAQLLWDRRAPCTDEQGEAWAEAHNLISREEAKFLPNLTNV